MTLVRRTTRTVTFSHPFYLGVDETLHGPGTFEVEITEELISNLSFPAYRKVCCSIALPMRRGISAGQQVIDVETQVLDEALARDAIQIRRETATDEICSDYHVHYNGSFTGPDHPIPSKVWSADARSEGTKITLDGLRSRFLSGLKPLLGIPPANSGRGSQ